MTDHTEDHDTLIKVETTVNLIYQRLFGPEQPGEIELIKDRIRNVETFQNRVSGAIKALWALIGLIGTALASHLFKSTATK